MKPGRLVASLASLALVACGHVDRFPDAATTDVADVSDGRGDATTMAGDGPVSDIATNDTGAPDTSPPRDVVTAACPASAACSGCASLSGCGYCATTASCVAANADDTASADGTCTGAAWFSSSVACPLGDGGVDPTGCSANTTCDDCDSNPDCGWCTATSRCLAANADGTASADGTCSGSDFDYDGVCAAPDDCAAATNCDDCTLLGTCGWCASSSRCLSGTGVGSDDGTCTGASWDWTNDMCVAGDGGSGAACDSATNCSDCTTLPSCGWCASSGLCVSGSSTGSNDATCSGASWSWTSDMCPASDGGAAPDGA